MGLLTNRGFRGWRGWELETLAPGVQPRRESFKSDESAISSVFSIRTIREIRGSYFGSSVDDSRDPFDALPDARPGICASRFSPHSRSNTLAARRSMAQTHNPTSDADADADALIASVFPAHAS